MSNSVDGFIGSFKDMARANKFNISINRLDGTKLKFHCKSAQMPEETFGSIPFAYRGRIVPIKGDREYADWSVTVSLDSTFKLRKDLYDWQQSMNSSRGNTGDDSLNSYSVDAKAEALDINGSPIMTFNFSYMWPKSIGAIEYSQDSMNQIAECQVTFAFALFEAS